VTELEAFAFVGRAIKPRRGKHGMVTAPSQRLRQAHVWEDIPIRAPTCDHNPPWPDHRSLKTNVLATLEAKHATGLCWRRDFEPELLKNSLDLLYLLPVRCRELPFANPEAVLEPDPNVATEHSRLDGNEHLVATGPDHRPLVGVAKQPIRCALHVQHVLGMRTDPSANAN